MAGLLRTAATAAMYSTRLTSARPPQMQRLLRKVPLSRLNGAKPARAAICLRLSSPSSGRWASRVLDNSADARYGSQRLITFAPDGSVTNHATEFVIEAAEPLLQPADVLLDAAV